MFSLFRAGRWANPPSLELSPPSIDVEVRRRCIDPFIRGVLIGAIAAAIGMLLGHYLVLPSYRAKNDGVIAPVTLPKPTQYPSP